MSQYLKRNLKTPLPKPPYPGSRLGGRHQINRAPNTYKGCRALDVGQGFRAGHFFLLEYLP